MAAVLVEAFTGRTEVISTSAEHVYFVLDAADEAAVSTLAAAEIPETYGAYLVLDRIEIADRVTETAWKVIAYYVQPDVDQLPSGGDPDKTFAFDTGSESQHITQSLETIAKYGTKAITTPKGGIGWDGERFQGADVQAPTPTWTETHWLSDEEFTAAYRRTLMRMAFKTNDDTWRDWSEGEVLFLGASCSRRGDDWDDPWEVTFRFAIRENKTGITIGDIPNIAKKGWEYLWVQYADAEVLCDDGKTRHIKEPTAVYVEKVYYAADFADLGIDE